MWNAQWLWQNEVTQTIQALLILLMMLTIVLRVMREKARKEEMEKQPWPNSLAVIITSKIQALLQFSKKYKTKHYRLYVLFSLPSIVMMCLVAAMPESGCAILPTAAVSTCLTRHSNSNCSSHYSYSLHFPAV